MEGMFSLGSNIILSTGMGLVSVRGVIQLKVTKAVSHVAKFQRLTNMFCSGSSSLMLLLARIAGQFLGKPHVQVSRFPPNFILQRFQSTADLGL